MRRRALLGLGVAFFQACGPKVSPRTPPAAPQVSTAVDLIPPDLDVLVRLDLEGIKSALGVAALSALAGDVLARGAPRQAGDDILLASLLQARRVYLGYRPSAAGMPLDRVLALDGTFTQLMRHPEGFSGATDLGADVRYWDARQAPARGGIARIYAASDRLRAFVSEAEIDAVERLLQGAPEKSLAAPEEGTLSLVARPALWRGRARGRLGELVDAAHELTGVLDLGSDGIRLKVTLELESAQQASELAAAARAALGHLLGDLAAHLEIDSTLDRVVVRGQFSRADLAPVVKCWWGASPGGAGCPW